MENLKDKINKYGLDAICKCINLELADEDMEKLEATLLEDGKSLLELSGACELENETQKLSKILKMETGLINRIFECAVEEHEAGTNTNELVFEKKYY